MNSNSTNRPYSVPAALPIVDIVGLTSSDPSAQMAVASELRMACEQHGFFYILNHGISIELQTRLFSATEAFFNQPMPTKLALNKALSLCNRGYEPLRAQTLEDGASPDLKESFYIGVEVAADDPRVLAGRFNTGPNQWPNNMPGFRETMNEYFDAVYQLGATLIHGLALSLEVPSAQFNAYLQNAAATLRLLHYPPQPINPTPGEKGCGEHTDFGGITLLLQDDTGGLQVWDTCHNSWIDAPPVPNSYVVNIGDLFERWTNGHYHSTLHRVINISGRERYSIPFFFTGNPNHLVECLPTCLGPGETPRYPPITVEQHQIHCYRRTYG